MREQDLADALQALAGRSFKEELAAWVHGREELPLQRLLQAQGVAVLDDADPLAQRLGLRVAESVGLQVKAVLHGGPAHAAGLAPGDEWLGIEHDNGSAWRLHKLEDLTLYAQAGDRLQALVSRDQQLLRLPLQMPGVGRTWRLAVKDNALVDRWLG